MSGLDRARQDRHELIGFPHQGFDADVEQLGLLSQGEPVQCLAQFFGGDGDLVDEVGAALRATGLLVVRGGVAAFGSRCAGCPLREKCTQSKDGRSITVHPKEATLQKARERQKAPEWKAKYRSTRPKVERKFGHLMSRRHGGRRARVRGCARVRQDFALLGAAINLKRLAALGVRHTGTGWSC